MENDYCIKLYYGTFENGYDSPRCAFEAADPEDASDDKIPTRLAENLDTVADDLCFNWDIQTVRLPSSLVQRIKADAIKEYQALCRN